MMVKKDQIKKKNYKINKVSLMNRKKNFNQVQFSHLLLSLLKLHQIYKVQLVRQIHKVYKIHQTLSLSLIIVILNRRGCPLIQARSNKIYQF